MMRSSDTASQLVKLCQTEFGCSVDNDCIGSRYVDTTFYNRTAHENIELLHIEVFHDCFKLEFRHLSVCNINSRFWDNFCELSCSLLNGSDFIVDVENLSSSPQFSLACFANNFRLPTLQECSNTEPVVWGCCDNRNVTNFIHGHTQGTRNRGCRECKDIDIGTEFFKVLFLSNSESVFLINDDQTQIGECNITLKQSMSSNGDINFAGFQMVHDIFYVGTLSHSGQQFYADTHF